MLCMFLVPVLLVVPGDCHESEHELEDRLKAAFLLNFAKFTNWPVSTDDQQVFRFCVVTQEPYRKAFHGLEKKRIGGKPVELVFPTIVRQEMCHLLFLSHSQSFHMEEILNHFSSFPALLISDIEGFARAGGIIEFVQQNDNLGFVINNSEAKEHGLQINSALLSLAARVL